MFKHDTSSIVMHAEKLLKAGESYEVVLTFLRGQGVSKLNSVKVLCNAAKLPLAEARRLVHNSVVWKDSFALDERFHDSLVKTVANLDSDDSVVKTHR
jgi:ribosomal protein L7/L12